MQKSFLQGKHWAKFQIALGREVILNDKYLAVVEKGRLGSRLYLPYGPYVKSSSEFQKILKELVKIAHDKNLDFIRIEPTGSIKEKDLEKLGFKRSKVRLQPMNTVVNYLGGEDFKIDSKMLRKERRYLRRIEKTGKKIAYSVSYKPSDIKMFLQQIHEVAARTGMRPHPDSYFTKMAKTLFPTKKAGLFIAKIDGVPAATIIFYMNEKTATYAHAASAEKYRDFSPMTGLSIYAMEFAREKGMKWFDWYGVAPEGAGPENHWFGLTQFKMAFSGDRVDYVGIWELPVKKGRYFLVNMAYSAKNLKKKILKR